MNTDLEKSARPEELGIPSGKFLDFLLYLEDRKLCMHNIMILRQGKIAVEAHFPPFTKDSLQRMYSVTKSFVSIALGFLIDEGKISLKSRIADFFPEYLNETVHPFIAEMTVRDCLLMATPYTDSTYKVHDKNWIQTFFTSTPLRKAGAVFNYDTSGTVALNALVEKLSGCSLTEYLRPRLFEPLGFSQGIWCVERPEGGDWGGSGLQCSIYDLARFGLFLLNKGRWQDRQLISSSYIEEACSSLIDNRIPTMSPEIQFGYGYQIWRTRHNGFCAWGMGSQLALCLPEKDTLLVATGDTQSISGEANLLLDAFWRHIYPYISDTAANDDPEVFSKLKSKLACLEFPSVEGEKSSPLQRGFQGKTYRFSENPMGIKWSLFEFSHDEGIMKYENASGVHELRFGLGKYVEGTFPETHYSDKRMGQPSGRGFRYKASAAWFNSCSLTFYLYIIDSYLGTLKVNCYFGENSLTFQMDKFAEWFLDEYAGTATGEC
jgi:CubicO group peptidase (beta-lactamase class C family)